MKTLLYVTDWDLRISGYTQIAIGLCTELAKSYTIVGIGLNYNRAEHFLPFNITRVDQNIAPKALLALEAFLKEEIAGVMIALDVPNAIKMVQKLEDLKCPIYGLFPLESLPLCREWATQLFKFNNIFVMSRFGTEECEKHLLPVTYLDVPVNAESWTVPTPIMRKAIRDNLGLDEDTIVLFSVAINQERKYLPALLETAGILKKRGHKVKLFLVTSMQDDYGFKIQELADDYDIVDCLGTWERGLAFKTLWTLYAAADFYVNTSKAEGLGVPVLEAMAMGLPVVASNHTALKEHLSQSRGILTDPKFNYIEAWGNSLRWIPDPEAYAWHIEYATSLWNQYPEKREQMVEAARQYVLERNWCTTAQEVLKVIGGQNVN